MGVADRWRPLPDPPLPAGRRPAGPRVHRPTSGVGRPGRRHPTQATSVGAADPPTAGDLGRVVYVANRSPANRRAGRARPSTTPCSWPGAGRRRTLIHSPPAGPARPSTVLARPTTQPSALPTSLPSAEPPTQRFARVIRGAPGTARAGRQGSPRQARYPWRGHTVPAGPLVARRPSMLRSGEYVGA